MTGRDDASPGDSEIRQRVCRVCGQTYAYPLRKSPATRFHCETCAGLPTAVRGVLEGYNKRLKSLAAALERMNPPGRAEGERAGQAQAREQD